MQSKIERKLTIASNVSLAQSIGKTQQLNSLRKQDTKLMASPHRLGDMNQSAVGDSTSLNNTNIKNIKEAKRVDISSPRFESARKALDIPLEECQIK
jgi:hypothetical protein